MLSFVTFLAHAEQQHIPLITVVLPGRVVIEQREVLRVNVVSGYFRKLFFDFFSDFGFRATVLEENQRESGRLAVEI